MIGVRHFSRGTIPRRHEKPLITAIAGSNPARSAPEGAELQPLKLRGEASRVDAAITVIHRVRRFRCLAILRAKAPHGCHPA